jgi:hypothetical protein
MMQLEATRTVVLAALTATQGALQTIEAMIVTHDRTDPAPSDNPWGTFDDVAAPPPSTKAPTNGQAKRSRQGGGDGHRG